MPIIELAPGVGVIPGGVNVGIVRAGNGRCLLVDAGLNETAGKKAIRAARDEWGCEIVAILTTHGHADHFGANAAVVKRTGAKVYAPALDEAVLRYPILMPVFLFAGADPLDDLRSSFLLADASPIDGLLEPGERTVEGVSFTVVPLGGHSPNQVGILVGGVFFCADVVLPETVLQKYRIPYLHGVTDHLASLDRAEGIPCVAAVPGHGPWVESLADLVAMNRNLVLDVMARIEAFCEKPRTAEEILGHLLRTYEAAVTDASSYYLLHPTVFAFLSHLHRTGRLTYAVADGETRWMAMA